MPAKSFRIDNILECVTLCHLTVKFESQTVPIRVAAHSGDRNSNEMPCDDVPANQTLGK